MDLEILCCWGTLECVLPAPGGYCLRFCMLTMSEKQSRNRVQLWHHFDVTSNIEDFMKSDIISKFNPARCR